MAKQQPERGTDEAFLQLMTVSGSSVLKLLGVAPEKADNYHFRAVGLKEKRFEPDVEGIPILESDDSKEAPVFVEFQGYKDPFIRYRLAASVFHGCAKRKYKSRVIAGIIYTAQEYQDAALSLSTVTPIQKYQNLTNFFKEIVLTDYKEKELRATDPKLIVLAPFTLDTETEKAALLKKSQKWRNAVKRVFPTHQRREALDILGLFILNRFRQLEYEEVRAMLDFDLMDTVAGRQVYDMGHQKGHQNGHKSGLEIGLETGLQKGLQKGHQDGWLEKAREDVLEVLYERFEIIPDEIIDEISAIELRGVLKQLHRQAIRCADIDSFNEILLRTVE